MYANQCAAYVAVQKNKMKEYGPNTYYLKDGQEFELGLVNYTKGTVAAQISINGKAISRSVIILKPGQVVNLERFIDENKKFKFETYMVDGSSEAKKAIQNNGDIEVKFYREREIPTYNPSIVVSAGGGNIYYNSTANPIYGTCITTSNYTASINGPKYRSATSADERCMNFMSDDIDWMADVKYRSAPVETGRVEKGGASNQKFDTYTGEFETWAFQTVSLKLLPMSQKPITISSLATYCTNCGTKNKKGNYKFCPTCGTKY